MILVHFPIAGCFFAIAVLITVRFTKQIAAHKLAYIFLLLVAISAFPAAITGGPSQEQLMPIPEEMKHLIDRHAMISLFATWALQLAGFMAIVGLVLLYWRAKTPQWLWWVAMGVLVVAAYTMAWCASMGGEIVHLEIRGHQILPAPEL